MKHFRSVLSLLLVSFFTITLSTQAILYTKTSFRLLCQEQTSSINHHTINNLHLPRKTIEKTKQRRLKRYRNHRKINRKRKIVLPKKLIAIKD